MAVDIVGGVTVFSGYHTQSVGEMRLAHVWRAEEYDIFRVFYEAHGGWLVDLAFVDGGLKGGIKVLQGLLDREPGHLDLLLIGPRTVRGTTFGIPASVSAVIMLAASTTSPHTLCPAGKAADKRN